LRSGGPQRPCLRRSRHRRGARADAGHSRDRGRRRVPRIARRAHRGGPDRARGGPGSRSRTHRVHTDRRRARRRARRDQGEDSVACGRHPRDDAEELPRRRVRRAVRPLDRGAQAVDRSQDVAQPGPPRLSSRTLMSEDRSALTAGEHPMKIRDVPRLPAEQLCWRCDPASLGFELVDELTPVPGVIGQDRAMNALRLATRMRNKGYNVFVTGAPGTGRTTVVKHVLETTDSRKPAPPDIVLVNNFRDPDRPRSLRLPAGRGHALAEDIRDFVEQLRPTLRRLFESERYKMRRAEAAESLQNQEKELVE